MSKVAVIGGSGIYNLDSVEVVNKFEFDTPFGKMSSPIYELSVDGSNFYFVSRHGEGHHITPSEVNYRANIYGLKKIGAKVIVSISAVGSLKQEHAPGNFVLVNQFIDWTKGQRKRTFFEDGVVGHVSVANPVDENLHGRLCEIIKTTDINHSTHGSYICIEGPQFSTRAESNIYRSFGADVIGMTNVPESYLAKEAGMAYATVAMVTDYDCWKEEHCTVEEIMKVMGDNYISAQKLVKVMIPNLVNNPVEFTPENKYAIVTNEALISSKSKEIINTLLH
ncbi:MAG: S-methyl-5'-thioadenosine phosphorylase [Bacteriovoracaceae bacterium]|jgi:5'-methylthioadenosine phosphorylase|nr:S-methyl-5'-thioadenosine phosphorylase [Bacteriovoracaceae bacterium]